VAAEDAAAGMVSRLLAGVDEVGVDLVLGGKRADAQHAVFALQPDFLSEATKLATSVGRPMPRLT
jgi:hypothetical protein